MQTRRELLQTTVAGTALAVIPSALAVASITPAPIEIVYEEVEFIDDGEWTAVRGVVYVKGNPENRKMVAVNCSSKWRTRTFSEWQIKQFNDGCYLEILKTLEPEIIAAFGVQ